MFTLVPSAFYDPASERQTLAEIADIEEGCRVEQVDIPQYDAVLIFTRDGDSDFSVPEIANVLSKLPQCPEYNKILCSIKDNELSLAIAQGRNLLLANSWKVQDFTTALYYIFLAVKSLQINPEMSGICFLSRLGEEDEMLLYRYFKSVVTL